MPRTYFLKSLFNGALTGALSTGMRAETRSDDCKATVIAVFAPLFAGRVKYGPAFLLALENGNIHGMANQDTLGQIVLMDEFLHVFGHDGIVMFVVMERVAMIPQILKSMSDFVVHS